MSRLVRRTNRLPRDEELSVALLADGVATVVQDSFIVRVPFIEGAGIEGPQLLRHSDPACHDEADVSTVRCVHRHGVQRDELLFPVETTEEREARKVVDFEEVVPAGADDDSARGENLVYERHGTREGTAAARPRDRHECGVVHQPLVHINVLLTAIEFAFF